ncbi:hypothetical protein ACFLV6_00970 [Chloroflexota bacterium]
MSRERRNETKSSLSEAFSGFWILAGIGQKLVQDGWSITGCLMFVRRSERTVSDSHVSVA